MRTPSLEIIAELSEECVGPLFERVTQAIDFRVTARPANQEVKAFSAAVADVD